jgi:hypothetical protein
MTFTGFAMRMWPYWCLGALMGWAVWKSDYKDLLRFEWKPFAKFFLFMCVVSIYRYFMISLMVRHGMGSNLNAVKGLPVGAVFMTPWEDACHDLPLVLLRRIIGTNKWTWPIHALAMGIVVLGFSSGHIYQGLFSAALIGLYIPVAVHFGKKRGFGTVMGCHVLYDFSTIMIIRTVLGC